MAGFTRRATNRFNDFATTAVLTPIVVVVLLVAGLIAIITWAFRELRGDGNLFPENSLPIVLIVGTVALLLTVAALVVIFARLSLTSFRSPLGLPEGSIRAIIALLLILLFFITAVFLYADVGRPVGEERVLEGVDAARLAAIPTDDIVQLQETGETFTVTLRTQKDSDSTDIAKQLITTVSTLVVAIAAFYFGSNSVQQAVEATRRGPDDDQVSGEGAAPVPGAPPPTGADPDPPGADDPTTEETVELVVATTADADDVPDTSGEVPQHHAPVTGAPS